MERASLRLSDADRSLSQRRADLLCWQPRLGVVSKVIVLDAQLQFLEI